MYPIGSEIMISTCSGNCVSSILAGITCIFSDRPLCLTSLYINNKTVKKVRVRVSIAKLGTSSTSYRLKISQGLHSKFWVLAWALSTEPCSWLEIYKMYLTSFPLTTQTLPIAWYFYQNLQFSPNIINKIMSAVFIEELWKNNISHYANDFTAIS